LKRPLRDLALIILTGLKFSADVACCVNFHFSFDLAIVNTFTVVKQLVLILAESTVSLKKLGYIPIAGVLTCFPPTESEVCYVKLLYSHYMHD
jgi:hypothetical protein